MTRRISMRPAREGYTPPAAPPKEKKVKLKHTDSSSGARVVTETNIGLSSLRVDIRNRYLEEEERWSPLPLAGAPMAMALSLEGVWEHTVGLLHQESQRSTEARGRHIQYYRPYGTSPLSRQSLINFQVSKASRLVSYQNDIMNLDTARCKIVYLSDSTTGAAHTQPIPLGMAINGGDFVFFCNECAILAARACVQMTGTSEDEDGLRQMVMLASEWPDDYDDMVMLHGELPMVYWAKVATLRGTRYVRLEATYDMGMYGAPNTEVVLVDMVAIQTFGGPTSSRFGIIGDWVNQLRAERRRKRDLKRAQEVRFVKAGCGAETYWTDRLGSPTVRLRTG